MNAKKRESKTLPLINRSSLILFFYRSLARCVRRDLASRH
jgi:hypothetical protein